MEPLHARYPFLTASRAAVEAADIDLSTVIREERETVVSRARERIQGAIFDGRVPDSNADTRTELLSYPVARIILSLVDQPVLTERYALAEARRAFDCITEDISDRYLLRSGRSHQITLSALLKDFDLADAIDLGDETHHIRVTAYLSLTEDLRDSRWRLSLRDLDDGLLPISQPELQTLLQEAVRKRVIEGLPLDVPPAIAATLANAVTDIERSLANVRVPTTIDTVDPDLFPPCIQQLISRLNAAESLSAVERFTVISFLTTIGMDADDVVTYFSELDEGSLRFQVEHIHGETRSTAYPPPSCAALRAVGGCVADAEACASIGHPVATYANALESAASVTEWRTSTNAD